MFRQVPSGSVGFRQVPQRPIFPIFPFRCSNFPANSQYPTFRNQRNDGYWGWGKSGNGRREIGKTRKMVDLRGNPFIWVFRQVPPGSAAAHFPHLSFEVLQFSSQRPVPNVSNPLKCWTPRGPSRFRLGAPPIIKFADGFKRLNPGRIW